MASDVALGQRAIDRVAQGVDADIGVGMPGKPLVMRHFHPAQKQRTPCLQHMHVEAGAHAGSQGNRHDTLQPDQIVRVGQLDVVVRAGDDRHRMACLLEQ